MPGARSQVSGVRSQVSGIRCQAPGVGEGGLQVPALQMLPEKSLRGFDFPFQSLQITKRHVAAIDFDHAFGLQAGEVAGD